MDQEETGLSPRLLELLSGKTRPGDSDNDVTIPEWFDQRLYEKGRKFFQKYFFCILFSQLLGLIAALYTFDTFTLPLIFTGNSETPKKALKRYISTTMHVIRWFEKDIFIRGDEGGLKDILAIRKIHKNVISQIKGMNADERNSIRIKADPFNPEMVLHSSLKKDLKDRVPLQTPFESQEEIGSQFNMAMTQYAFIGILVAHPRMVGVWWASEDEMEGFLHYWRNIGWVLGMEDRFNLCTGNPKEVKSLCIEIEQKIIIPQHAKVSANYEHLSEAVVRGISFAVPSISFPGLLLFIKSTLGFTIPETSQHLLWVHYFQYFLMRFVFNVLLIIPQFVSFFNYLLRSNLSMLTGGPPPIWFIFMRSMIRDPPYKTQLL